MKKASFLLILTVLMAMMADTVAAGISINWQLGANHPTYRKAGVLGVFEGMPFSIAGMEWPWAESAQAYSYDISLNQWQDQPDLPVGFAYTNGIDVEDAVYICGGRRDGYTRAECYKMYRSGDSIVYSQIASLLEDTGYAGIGKVGTKIIIAGGNKGRPGQEQITTTSTMDRVEYYDTANPQLGWRDYPPLPVHSRYSPCLCGLGDKLYVFGGTYRIDHPEGGSTFVRMDNAHVLDTTTGTWSNIAPMPEGRSGAAAVPYDNRYIIILGGYRGDSVTYGYYDDHVLIYDTVEDTYTTLPNTMPFGAHNMCAVIIGNKIYVVGGEIVDPPNSYTDNHLKIGEISLSGGVQGWDLYVGCSSEDGWPAYPGGTVVRYDGLTGAFKPGAWNPGQPNEQVKPDCLFAEANLSYPMHPLVRPDGTVHVSQYAVGGVLVYDQHGNPVVQNPNSNPPNMLYSTVYGGTTKMLYTDSYAFICGRFLQDSAAGGVARFELEPASKPTTALNPWFIEAPLGIPPIEPYSFELLPDGRWLVLDSRGFFYWFASDGTYLSKMQLYVSGDPVLASSALDLVYHDGYVYVTLMDTNQVRRWKVTEGYDWVVDPNWRLYGYVAFPEMTLLPTPWGMTFGPDGNIYLASRGNDKVMKYSGLTGGYIYDFIQTSPYAHNMCFLTFAQTGGVTGTFTLKDWAGVTEGIAATIELLDGVGTTVETKNVILGADGGFSFRTNLEGSFTAVAKAGHWLAKALPLSIQAGSGSVSFELTNGDCNGDNGVDELDYALLSNAWWQGIGDPAYNANADLNGDGGVDELDYAILSNAWYTAGD